MLTKPVQQNGGAHRVLASALISFLLVYSLGELRDPLDEDELEAELAELESVVLSDGVSTGTGECWY